MVCLVGPMGCGKSVLLRQVSDRLAESRPAGMIRTVRGVPALRGVPGAAVGEGWSSGVTHLVDDADEIDETSAATLRRLAEETDDAVLLTVSARRRLPESFAAMLDAEGAVVLPIPSLDGDSARSLMGEVLEGRVEAATARRALEWGAGTPLGVARFAESARTAGVVVDSGRYLAVDRRFTPGPSDSTGDAATRHRYRLPADDLAAVTVLEYVAMARELPYPVLLDVVAAREGEDDPGPWRAAVRDLLDRGVLEEDTQQVPGGGIRFAHPAAAWSVRDDLGGMGRLSVATALRQAAGPRERWSACAWVGLVAEGARAGLDVPATELEEAVRTFAAATGERESDWVDAGAALVSALSSEFVAGTDDDVLTSLADIAVALQRAMELDTLRDLLAPAVARGHVAATFACAYLLQDGIGETVGAGWMLGEAAASARADGRDRDADMLEAGRQALARRAGATYPDADVDLPEGAPRFLAAEVTVTLALRALWQGRILESLELFSTVADITPGGCAEIAIQGEVLPALALTLMAWGHRGDDGNESAWSWLPLQQVNVHAGVGILLADRGVVVSALESLEQALSATVPAADAAIVPHLHRWAAAAAGRAGRDDEARRHLEATHAGRETGKALDGVLGAESARLELAAAAAAPGPRFTAAVAAARAALGDAVDRGRHLVAMNLLWELWRSGEDVDPVRWAATAARVDGDRAAALGGFLAAMRDGDAEAMLAASESLAACGETASAAEAASLATELFHGAGDRSEAARAVAVAVGHLEELGPVLLPRTSLRTPDDPRLTEREREIAGMVAEGRSNPEIAEVLFLSKRTVDSHVYRILGKLDITDRRQLRSPTGGVIDSTGSLSAPFGER